MDGKNIKKCKITLITQFLLAVVLVAFTLNTSSAAPTSYYPDKGHDYSPKPMPAYYYAQEQNVNQDTICKKSADSEVIICNFEEPQINKKQTKAAEGEKNRDNQQSESWYQWDMP